MVNLVNAERVSVTFGTTVVLDDVSLGLGTGDVIGVVGRNGSGKTTLLRLLTGLSRPDEGRVIRTGNVSVGYLRQADDIDPTVTVRDVIVDGAPDHVWAADPDARTVVDHLLAGIGLERPVAGLSGGEQRRTALVAALLGRHDLLVLDEPTNHLDVEAVDWLASHIRTLTGRGLAMLVVSHDRWFLDRICTRIWEVHDGSVDPYDGGYAAYVLARAERARLAAGMATRRKNLLRKELAWLRRGAPARTSKPKFRTDAANELIADEPAPRDSVALQEFAVSRLGKDVFDLTDVTVTTPDRTLLEKLSWSIGPGERIGLIGVNGSGKTTLLKVLAGERGVDSGTVRRGRTLALGHLSQAVAELPESERVLDFIQAERRVTRLANGREVATSSLSEDFGFTGDRLVRQIRDLSGGERRRLQLLRLLLGEPNVLLLDEPTNDLDIDTLTVVEDFLDGWPGTVIVVSHDRYFLERVCDVTYALLGDGRCVLLPGGVDQYLELRRATTSPPVSSSSEAAPTGATSRTASARRARKDLARIEGELERLDRQTARLHEEMAGAASDYLRLSALQVDLARLASRRDELEETWLSAAEQAEQ